MLTLITQIASLFWSNLDFKNSDNNYIIVFNTLLVNIPFIILFLI